MQADLHAVNTPFSYKTPLVSRILRLFTLYNNPSDCSFFFSIDSSTTEATTMEAEANPKKAKRVMTDTQTKPVDQVTPDPITPVDMDDITTSSLEALQSDGQRKILDIVDDLRRQGLSGIVELPQLVVCGDQSSGDYILRNVSP